MQFKAVSASVLNILNQVTSDRIFILLLLTYQKQLVLFLLHRVVLSNSIPKSTVIMERVVLYNTER